MDDLKARLERLIDKLGGVDAVADAAGLERTTIYSIRRGGHRAGRKALAALARAGMRIKISDLNEA